MQFAAVEPLLNRTRLRLRFPCVIGQTEAIHKRASDQKRTSGPEYFRIARDTCQNRPAGYVKGVVICFSIVTPWRKTVPVLGAGRPTTRAVEFCCESPHPSDTAGLRP